MVFQLPAVHQGGSLGIFGAAVIKLAQLPGGDHVQFAAGENHVIGQVFTQGNFPGGGHVYFIGVQDGVGHGAVNIQRCGPQIFAVIEKAQIQDDHIRIGGDFIIHVGAPQVLDLQLGAHIRAHHDGHVFGTGFGKLDGVFQGFVIGGLSAFIQNMQLASAPCHHMIAAAGEGSVAAQGVVPFFVALGIQAEQGDPVIIHHIVAKGGHTLGSHAAQAGGGHTAVGGNKVRQHADGDDDNQSNRCQNDIALVLFILFLSVPFVQIFQNAFTAFCSWVYYNPLYTVFQSPSNKDKISLSESLVGISSPGVISLSNRRRLRSLMERTCSSMEWCMTRRITSTFLVCPIR